MTVALAVFTAFPMFAKFQDALQRWLVESLIPDNIARQVLGYLTQFASQAKKLGVVGMLVLFGSAWVSILTIDRALNHIWRVRQLRPLRQRILVYWACISLGPLVLGMTLVASSYAVSITKGVAGIAPGSVAWLLDGLQFLLLAMSMAALYHYVPNTTVKWRHAWVGGLFVAASFEITKKLLVAYLSKVPTYSIVYGAFATVPILLIWIYVAWAIVLLGAVVAAYLPSLLTGQKQRLHGPGFQFQLALETLQTLDQARTTSAKGASAAELAQRLRVDGTQLAPVLATLRGQDWIGLLAEEPNTDKGKAAARYVLLVTPEQTPLAPLLNHLLLPQDATSEKLWHHSHWATLTLRQVI
jgi:membrane protein